MHVALSDAFDRLLTTWRAHNDLKRSPRTSFEQLAAARIELDEARRDVSRLRVALHPYGNDVGLIDFALLCDRLDEVVHIPKLEVERTDGDLSFRCVCGESVRSRQPA